MLPAVEFDGKAKAWTIKIKREWSDGMLPPELQTIELATAKRPPKLGFSVRHVVAKASGAHGHGSCA
jgi:hypothetical protein